MRPPRMPNEQGFTLLEISLAMGLYAMGLSGFALMLMVALQGTVNASVRSQAIIHASSAGELILMNASGTGHPALPPEQDMQVWSRSLRANVPGAWSMVCFDSTPGDGRKEDAACDESGLRVLKVFWHEPGEPDSDLHPARLALPLPE